MQARRLLASLKPLLSQLLGIAIIACTALHSVPAAAWDNLRTHPDLAFKSYREFAADGRFDRYLRQDLELPNGITEPLAVELGFDSAVDQDIGPPSASRYWTGRAPLADASRLEVNFIPFHTLPEKPARVYLNRQPCPHDDEPSFESCFKQLKRFPIQTWILNGTFAEDNPNPRSMHHFHDPELDHPSGSGDFGLDNRLKYLLGTDTFIEEAIALGRGGTPLKLLEGYGTFLARPFSSKPIGNFAGKGRSALDRALDLSLNGERASDRDPKNFFALPDSERYLYRAVTSPFKDERESFLALHFEAFGSVLHLLQDMSSVAHTRNDFLLDHVWDAKVKIHGTSLEWAGQQPLNEESVFEELNGFASGPKKFLEDHAVQNSPFVLSDYLDAIDAPDLTGISIPGLWDETPEVHNFFGRGLAEYVHRRFFSAGTVSNSDYAYPRVPSCAEIGNADGGGVDRVWVTQLPLRDLATGGPNGAELQPYLSSTLVPHLARCRFDSLNFVGSIKQGQPIGVAATVLDESVQRDYLELLWPLTIEYGKQLMQSVLGPRLQVIPIGANAQGVGQFKLANLTPFDFQFDPSAISIWYDTPDALPDLPKRVEVPVACHGGSSGTLTLPAAAAIGQQGPPGNFICDMPQSLPAPALQRDDFYVVVRGALGQRGQVGTPDEYDATSPTKDFVVAFQHVLGERITVDQDTGSPSDPSATDGNVVNDVKIVEFSIPPPGSPPSSNFRIQNLTQAFREQQSLPPTVDFCCASAGPTGSRMAFGGDVQNDSGSVAFVNPSEFYIVDFLDPTVFHAVQLPPGAPLPVINVDGGPKWNQNPSLPNEILYSGNATQDSGASAYLVRLDVASNSVTVSANAHKDVVSAAFGDTIVATSSAAQLYVLDPATGDRMYRFSTFPAVQADALVVDCTPGCLDQPGLQTRAPTFSPDGKKLAYLAAQTGDTSYEVFAADLSNGIENAPIDQLSTTARADATGHLTWSKDGRWIAFASTDGTIKVIPASGGAPIEVLPFNGARLSWLPGLVLP